MIRRMDPFPNEGAIVDRGREKDAMRNKYVDCIRGIGIVLVVLGHTGFPYFQSIGLYHMAVFFILSGYCHHEAYSENRQSVFVFCKKRVKSLYIPYVFSNLALLCFHNLFYRWNIYTDNPLFLQSDLVSSQYGLIGAYSVRDFMYQFILTVGFLGGEQLAGVLWFLRNLFQIEIFYVVMDWFSRRFPKNRKYVHGMVFLGITLIGWLVNAKGIHMISGLENCCYYFIFFGIGIFLQKTDFWRTFSNRLTLAVSAAWLLVNGFLITRFAFVSHNRYFPPFYIMNGIMGGVFLKSIAGLCMEHRIERILDYLGKHSMTIMLWHFLSFKVVSFGYIKSVGLPAYCLASFPYLQVKYLWIVYTAAGILLPLVAEHVAIMIIASRPVSVIKSAIVDRVRGK